MLFSGVAHGECVFHQLQHFRIVAAVADGDALLRRELPAFEQAADAVRFVQPGIIKSTKPKPLVTGFMMPSSETQFIDKLRDIAYPAD